MKALTVCALALALFGIPAWAQDKTNNVEVRDGYEPITPNDFKRLPADTPDGKKFTIHYVKFNKLFGEDLKLYGGAPKGRPVGLLRGLVKVENKRQRRRLIDNLNANKDSDGKKLTKNKSNVQLFGVGKRTSRGYVLMVNRVHLLDSFKEHFTEAYAELPEGKANARLALVRRIERAVRFHEADREALEPLILTLRKEARAVEFGKLPKLPGGLKEHLRFARKHHDIELLDQAWNHEGLSEDDRQAIAGVLRDDLKARLLLGKWYDYESFKEKLGFGQTVSGDWVPAGQLDLVVASAEERKRRTNLEVAPQVDVGLLDVAAKKGDVIPGMDKGRVIAAKRGYPVSVIRVREKHKKRTLMWTQWVMEDGSKVYFLNGFAFKKEEGE